ncbi:MAG: DUF3187 family protein [candidate division KSB1 bacterium]|nr:DUF3187 family protein [candidate division KSB1 bacterium]MDZ7275901.1 DUF3187 family protein [candidate division KSB1 bacterium]MDZ7287651.1 DUF3187 family protein [candidate division KSB1 bacterium]MDZ7350629.1 DUF3187 family protein [candidate division KSB1 bacterium]MDZ7355001.1 DUF3187 family protein [candidate division KSB1 bacterium]
MKAHFHSEGCRAQHGDHHEEAVAQAASQQVDKRSALRFHRDGRASGHDYYPGKNSEREDFLNRQAAQHAKQYQPGVLRDLAVQIHHATIARAAAEASVATGMRRGPLPARNQFPTVLPFLLFSSEPAVTQPPQRLRVGLTYDRANTFVKSGGIVEQLDSPGRRNPFTAATVQRIVHNQPAADAFLLDCEVSRWTLRTEYAPLAQLSFAAELPVLRVGGYFMDPVIEGFHQFFSLPQGGRPAFLRHDTSVFLYFDQQLFFGNGPDLAGIGVGDLSLLVKREFATGGKWRPALAARAALELPTGSAKKLRGNGAIDFGVALSASWAWPRHWLDLNLAVTKPGRWQILPELELSPIYAIILIYEHAFGERLSLLVQDRHTSSPLAVVTRAGISRMAHEITAGMKLDGSHGLRWSIALTENYAYFNSSPDLGLQVGVEAGWPKW